MMSVRMMMVAVGALLFAHAHASEPAPTQVAALSPAALAVSGLRPDSDKLYPRALAELDERLARDPDDLEASLLKGLLRFKSGDLDGALDELQGLTRRAPKFHLAHLIQGDLMLARSHTISDIGEGALLADPAAAEDLARLRTEADTRLNAYLASFDAGPRRGLLPRALLLLGGGVETALLVDKSSHRLYLYRRGADGEPELVRDYYVSTGKLEGDKRSRGDLRTPEGVYFITSHIPDERLPDKYGIGAWPMNYPNEWDRRLGKTGDGIWLHGTERLYYSRPPLDSEGCVVLPNLDLDRVSAYLQPGLTPIVVTERAVWLEPEAWRAQRRELLSALEGWREDWAGGDVEAYLRHYDGAFWSGQHDLPSWSKRKRRISQSKEYQKVELSDLSLYIYPEADEQGRLMAVANFRQRYDSNNFQSDMRKRLYLSRADDGWRVLYEGGQ